MGLALEFRVSTSNLASRVSPGVTGRSRASTYDRGLAVENLIDFDKLVHVLVSCTMGIELGCSVKRHTIIYLLGIFVIQPMLQFFSWSISSLIFVSFSIIY